MAQITLNISGIPGLVERYHGDLGSTSSSPNLRYLGADGQLAEGIYNPMKKYGFMSPSVNAFNTLTGTVSAKINSIIYDPSDDKVFLSEDGENILTLSSLDDTSLTTFKTIDSGSSIKDMVLYEMNGKKSIFYAIDSNNSTDGSYVGFSLTDVSSPIDHFEKDERENTNRTEYEIVDTTSEDRNTFKYRRLSQQFRSQDMAVLAISAVSLTMDRNSGTGSGITYKVSIQTESDPDSGIYTSQGAWADSTSYSINDTVTIGASTWQCIQAHTSNQANDEPGAGSAWHDYWNFFGAPSGTELASATISGDVITSTGNAQDGNRYRFDFNDEIVLDENTTYWIVLEESGTNATSSDRISWLGTTNDSGSYDAANTKGYLTSGTAIWTDLHFNAAEQETLDFKFDYTSVSVWTSKIANGAFDIETGLNQYLYLADNSLLYWITGNKLHTLDGSVTGGIQGRVVENVLRFPSYITIPDITETRSRMYIAVQSSDITSGEQSRYFNANKSGIYVWDRRSQVLGNSDFVPTPGAKEIKKLFQSSNGSIKAITIGNSGYTEIRAMSGNEFAVIHTLEKEAYPVSRRAVSQLDNISVWLGANGIFYGYGSIAPGQTERLYKLGDMSGEANAGLEAGPIFIGHEESSEPRSAVLFGWSDSDPSYIVQKWYPNGEDTINTVAQTANQGNVYSKLEYLPSLSTLRNITIYCAPTSTSDDTTIATIKFYKNQSTTPFSTKTVTNTQTSRGYLYYEFNEHNCNAFQYEIEFATNTIEGDNEFEPSLGILEFDPTNTQTKDRG